MTKYEENVCRICLSSQDPLISFFRRRKGISPYDKLVKYTKLCIKPNDAGPACICSQCITELDRTVIFLEKCEKSSQILCETLSKCVNEDNNCNLDNLKVDLVDQTLTEGSQDTCMIGDELKKQVNVSKLVDVNGCTECGSKRRCKHWSPPTAHTCLQCGKVFNKKYNYQLHIKRHLGELDWPCPSCGLPQLTQWHAERHCTPRLRRPCPFLGCTKTFTTNNNLKTHLRVHNGERPYKCHDCGKDFRCRNTLSEHVRIHTGVKPYICPVCGIRFRTNKLTAHMQSAHPDPSVPRTHSARTRRPTHTKHVCSLCSARYAHKQSLNKHMRHQHDQKPKSLSSTEVKG